MATPEKENTIKHELIDNRLVTTITKKKPSVKTIQRIEQMDKLQSSLLDMCKELEQHVDKTGTEYTQTMINTETISVSITRATETGLPLTAISHDLTAISSKLNEYINELKG